MPRKMHNRGSVLLMAVGLLTMIALLGGAFLVVAGLSRKTAAVFARQGRMEVIAKSKLLEVAMTLATDVPTSITTDVKKLTDSPTVDPWLTVYDPSAMAGAVTTLTGSGMKDSSGNEYQVGSRIHDGSGMINVNLANKITMASAGTPISAGNISLSRYFGGGAAGVSLADQIHSGTGASSLYMMDEWLSFLGGAVPAQTATGRVKRILNSDTLFASVGGLCTRSVSRYSVLDKQCDAAHKQAKKADLNEDSATALYNAFYNLLAGTSGDREAQARTLAMRAVDFTGSGPSKWSNGTKTYYGLVRQPFITKAAYHREAGNDMYAIELFNPYTTGISMTGCKLSTGGGTFDVSIGAGSKVTLVNKSGLAVNGTAITVGGLDLTKKTAILCGGWGDFPIGVVDPSDFSTGIGTTPAAGEKRFETIRRDDTPSKAIYSVAMYRSDASAATGDPAVAGAGLGSANGISIGGVLPHPVYVRNGKFINVGDLMRIYYAEVSVASDGTVLPLDKSLAALTPTLIDNGRLAMFTVTGGPGNNVGASTMSNPMVPQGCKATEYFMVKDTANVDTTNLLTYGQVNISTAPAKVMACLPGISGFSDADAKAAVLVKSNYETAGQIAMFMDASFAATSYTSYLAYAVAPDGSDDGLSTSGASAVMGDLTKRLAAYAWMSNNITVKSDIFVVYVQAQLTVGATSNSQKYVGVIDRSMVKAATDKPAVLMFSPIY